MQRTSWTFREVDITNIRRAHWPSAAMGKSCLRQEDLERMSAFEADPRRAAILAEDPDGKKVQVYANGLPDHSRNRKHSRFQCSLGHCKRAGRYRRRCSKVTSNPHLRYNSGNLCFSHSFRCSSRFCGRRPYSPLPVANRCCWSRHRDRCFASAGVVVHRSERSIVRVLRSGRPLLW
jgi:hypothetical protein